MIQGLSMGVEAPLFAAYALEVAPPGREAWYAGTLQAFSQFGLLLASTVAFVSSLVLGGDQMSEWGWRIPFIFGGLIGLFVIWMRRGLPESLHGDTTNEKPQQSSRDVLRSTGKSKLAICTIILVVGGAQVLNYGWVAGVPSAAASVLSEDATLIFGLTSAMTLGVLIMSPIAGHIADRFGVGRTFVWSRWLSIPFVFTLVILFMWPSGGRLAVVMAAGIVLLAFAMGIFNAVTSSLVPQHSRVTSVGIGHAVGVAVFGGTASYILVWLASKGIIWVFPVYVALLLAASAVLYRITYKRNGLHGVEYAKTESRSQQDSSVNHQLSS
ncbi:MFS transporter [Brevibacterium sp. SMBL_HHYL_HB1]|uniref:MFS transporter n=1 Tax=Brevibacterium sp. SMBL_HHYL_HB1 TaxID=2777556 RepID=UPI001BAB1EF3|nr:MFS transporter [Brevibacterium sp. SMBL_HHYL_HB1]QUL77867.1 MFS transporter [Brevibacterium sp. SMBL_HHYL_HB1]